MKKNKISFDKKGKMYNHGYPARFERREIADLQFASTEVKPYIDKLYHSLVDSGFGVTLIGPHLTIRTNNEDNELVTISLMITGADVTEVVYIDDK